MIDKDDFLELKEEDEEISQEEDFIFREMQDIREKVNILKSGMEFDEKIKGTNDKEDYESRKHDFRITGLIYDFGSIEVPDIMEDVKILKELMNEKELDEDEKKIIQEEYVNKVESLVIAVNSKKDSIEKLFNYMNNIKF